MLRKLAPPVLALVIAALIAIYLDQQISLFWDLKVVEAPRHFAASITDIGKSEQWFALAIIVYIIARWRWQKPPNSVMNTRDRNLMNWSWHMLSALTVSGLLLHVVKVVFGRQRPYMTLDHQALEFRPFTMDWNFGSFASGHTQTLFCVASLMVLLWPRKSAWIWATAALLSFTRVMAIQHFASDIIGGALIGIYGAQLSILLLSKKIPAPKALS